MMKRFAKKAIQTWIEASLLDRVIAIGIWVVILFKLFHDYYPMMCTIGFTVIAIVLFNMNIHR
jgi:hypothetical protein